MKLKVRRSLVEGNELENRAARHRKKQKGMSPFSYLNPDAGDVEKGIKCFNRAIGVDAPSSRGAGEATDAGAAMGEGYFNDQGKTYKNEAISEDVVPYVVEYYVEADDLRIYPDEIKSYARDIIRIAEKRIKKEFPEVELDFGDYDWLTDIRLRDRGYIYLPTASITQKNLDRISSIFKRIYIDMPNEDGLQTLYVEDAYEDED